jgi:hypothetical protein
MSALLTMLRFLSAAILLAFAAFCVFGFLASFEYPWINRWHVICGLTGIGTLALAGRLSFRRITLLRSIMAAMGLFALLFALLLLWIQLIH